MRFEFIIDPGYSTLRGDSLKKEYTKLIKYFLASLTVSEDNLWVNLSPYENDRIVPEEFGITEMGRDLLSQDYLLKKLTASLSNPEKELGQKFWKSIHEKVQDRFKNTDIPVATFNKVWIIPDKAVVYENKETAFIVETHLKVMIDKDYVALQKSASNSKDTNIVNDLSSQLTRDIILPAIEKEVNEGAEFAPLRQIYHSLILATWFKRNLRQSVLGQVYIDQSKVEGVNIVDRDSKHKIYQQYLNAFKTGAYQLIKEEYDPQSQEMIPRKYFAGGIDFVRAVNKIYSPTIVASRISLNGNEIRQSVNLVPHRQVNAYIQAHLPDNLLENPSNIDNYDGAIVPIEGLFSTTGQFAHIGLGQIYGKPVIYIDAEYRDNDDVIAHEQCEIEKWEEQRKKLGLSSAQMRGWILENFDEAHRLAQQWHAQAPSIEHLLDTADIPVLADEENYLEIYSDETDINLAAGSPSNREKLLQILRASEGLITPSVLRAPGLSRHALYNNDYRQLVQIENQRRKKEEPKRPLLELPLQTQDRKQHVRDVLKTMDGKVVVAVLSELSGVNEVTLTSYNYRQLIDEENARRELEEPDRELLESSKVPTKDIYGALKASLAKLEGRVDLNIMANAAGMSKGSVMSVDYRALIKEEFERRQSETPNPKLIYFRGEVNQVLVHVLRTLDGKFTQAEIAQRIGSNRGTVDKSNVGELIEQENKRRAIEEPGRPLIIYRALTKDPLSAIKEALTRMDGIITAKQLSVAAETNNITLNKYQYRKLIQEENSRRELEEPNRPPLALSQKEPAKNALALIQHALRRIEGRVTLEKIAAESQTNFVTVHNHKHRELIAAENRRRAIEEPDRPLLEALKSSKEILQDLLKTLEGEITITEMAAQAGLNRATVKRVDVPDLISSENERRLREEPDRRLIVFKEIPRSQDALLDVTQALRKLEGLISPRQIAAAANVGTTTVYRMDILQLITEENIYRLEHEPQRPLLELNKQISTRDYQAQIRLVREHVEGDFGTLFKDIKQSELLSMVSRYSLDIRTILWGIVGARLEGRYDKAIVEEVIDGVVWDFIDGATQDRTLRVAQGKELGVADDPIKIFAPAPLTQEQISGIAGRIRKSLDSIQNKSEEQDVLLKIAEKQSLNFIKALEEQYFFREYYSNDPDQFIGQKAHDAISGILAREEIPWVKVVLKELLSDIDEAIKLQTVLYSRGMKPNTAMNLYQLVAVQRMARVRKVILADEMGLGKTLEAISTFLLSDKKEMLALTPKKALSRWVEDLYRHTDTNIELVILADMHISPELQASNPRISIRTFKNLEERNAYLYIFREKSEGQRRIILANYELMSSLDGYRLEHGLAQANTEFIALDEAHILKNRASQISRIVYGDKEGKDALTAEYKLLLTGTPLENRIQDLFGYLQYLAQGETDETSRFISSIDMAQFKRIFNKSELPKLSLLYSYLTERMVRRLKDDVMVGLPQKQIKIVRLNPFAATMTINGGDAQQLSGNYIRQMELYERALCSTSIIIPS